MKRGILKITSLEKFEMRFISYDGKINYLFDSNKVDFRNLFCSSSLEQAYKGVKASYGNNKILTTDEWDILRSAKFMSGGDYQLSYSFC